MDRRSKCLLNAIFQLLCMIQGYTSQDLVVPPFKKFRDTVVGLKNALLDFQIIPDVLEDVPLQVIKVKFQDKIVNLGNKLTLLDIMVPPTHVSWEFEKGALYTLIMSGPDYPSRMLPEFREYPHWVVGNIPGNSYLAGETVFDYHDPPETYHPGTHRFVFTLYKQNGSEPVEFDENILKKENMILFRKYFKTEIFGRKYRMEAPIGVNFFEVDL
ncbi:unnamed protein product [Bemisia tabaci]|uniref:Phosphatidylethanolamine-binding protein n=2 Tax=Bemisia tabaci TaxID=7038 RepID=A0A9P0F156_BEMTA|nr:unnamed protein product [Bemisia tabaci]